MMVSLVVGGWLYFRKRDDDGLFLFRRRCLHNLTRAHKKKKENGRRTLDGQIERGDNDDGQQESRGGVGRGFESYWGIQTRSVSFVFFFSF